jgi:hypothetical protein
LRITLVARGKDPAPMGSQTFWQASSEFHNHRVHGEAIAGFALSLEIVTSRS